MALKSTLVFVLFVMAIIMNGHMEAALEPGKDKSEKYSIDFCTIWQNQCVNLHIPMACDMYHRWCSSAGRVAETEKVGIGH
jgi:hypothetical protein